jgi:hypothetical protein
MERTDPILLLEHPKLSKWDIFLVFWLICVSGNPLFDAWGGKYIYVGTAFGVMVISIYYGRPLYSLKLILFLLGSIVLFLLQSTILSEVSSSASVSFLARIYLGFLITSFLGSRFRFAYMKVMFFVAVVSLVFWLINAVVDFPGIEVGRYRSIVVFNYIIKTDIYSFTGRRNSGMFWEPGAYQSFIMVVPLLFIGQIKELWVQYRKECVILILALLSTMSTTGYMVFAVLILLILLKNVRNIFLRTITVVSSIMIFMWAYNTFDFLGEKIEGQYEDVLELEDNEANWGRMGAMKIDIKNIERHPIVGNGFLMSEKYGVLGDSMAGAGNGFSGSLNTFGIPFIVLYFFLLYKNASASTKYESMIFPIIVMFLLNGEYFLNYPLFWSFIFIQYPYILQYEENSDIDDSVQSQDNNLEMLTAG